MELADHVPKKIFSEFSTHPNTKFQINAPFESAENHHRTPTTTHLCRADFGTLAGGVPGTD